MLYMQRKLRKCLNLAATWFEGCANNLTNFTTLGSLNEGKETLQASCFLSEGTRIIIIIKNVIFVI